MKKSRFLTEINISRHTYMNVFLIFFGVNTILDLIRILTLKSWKVKKGVTSWHQQLLSSYSPLGLIMFKKTPSVTEIIFSVPNLYYDKKIKPSASGFLLRDLPSQREHVHVSLQL